MSQKSSKIELWSILSYENAFCEVFSLFYVTVGTTDVYFNVFVAKKTCLLIGIVKISF